MSDDEFQSDSLDNYKNNSTPLIPQVIWAQRKQQLYVSFYIELAGTYIAKIENQQLYFHALTRKNNDIFEISIPLYSAVDKINGTYMDGDFVVVEVQKLHTDTRFWPRLTLDDFKYEWLNIDTEYWVEEEEENIDCYEASDMTEKFENTTLDDGINVVVTETEYDKKSGVEEVKTIPKLDINEPRINDEKSKNE